MTTLRRLPQLRYCVRLWRRSLIIFVLLRALATQGTAVIDGAMGQAKSGLSPPAFAVLLAIVGWLVLLSGRMRRETRLMQNLGVSTPVVLFVALGPLVAVEFLIQLLT